MEISSQVFYRKWRPQSLAEVVGQQPIAQTLMNALKSSRISHAYLFCGPRGTGKTSTARILAKAVNCLTSGKGEPCNTCAMCQAVSEGRALDVIEIDAASNTGVDDIRSLREKVNYAPSIARYKVYIIDEVHMLSNAASNALLKTLEEPPAHVIFILATTESHKILPTIVSRCQRFDFRRLSQVDVAEKLEQICKTEGVTAVPEALRLVARAATGSLRDAENLLQQLITQYGRNIQLAQVQALLGITGDWRVKELVRHIVKNDITSGITTVNAVNSDGLDLKQFSRELVEYLRALLLIKTGSGKLVDLPAEDVAELTELAAAASLGQVLTAVKLFGQADTGLENHSTLALELALVECALAADSVREDRSVPALTVQKEPEKAPPPAAATRPAPKPRAPAPEKAAPAPAETSPAQPPAATAAPAAKKVPAEKAPQQETPKAAAPTPPAKQPEPPRAASSPPAKPESGQARPELGTEIERLKQNWRHVFETVPEDVKRSPLVALMRSGVRPVSIEGDVVTIAFRYTYHKEQTEKPENLKIAEKIISGFLGRACRVRCVLENNHLLKEALKMGAQITHVEEK